MLLVQLSNHPYDRGWVYRILAQEQIFEDSFVLVQCASFLMCFNSALSHSQAGRKTAVLFDDAVSIITNVHGSFDRLEYGVPTPTRGNGDLVTYAPETGAVYVLTTDSTVEKYKGSDESTIEPRFSFMSDNIHGNLMFIGLEPPIPSLHSHLLIFDCYDGLLLTVIGVNEADA